MYNKLFNQGNSPMQLSTRKQTSYQIIYSHSMDP